MPRHALMRQLLAAIACSGALAAQAADVVMTMNSYGPIQVGMSTEELQRHLRSMGRGPLPSPAKVAKKGCTSYAASDALKFMLENGHVVRIETREKDVVTPSGIRVGSSVDRVRHVLGSRIEEQTQGQDGADARSIVLISGDQRFGIRVDAAGQTVTGMSTGTAHTIRRAGGCD